MWQALQQVELYDFYGEQLKACDLEIERQLAAFVPKVDLNQQPLPPSTRRSTTRPKKNHPQQDCDLHLPDGRSGFNSSGWIRYPCANLLSEIGTDMSK